MHHGAPAEYIQSTILGLLSLYGQGHLPDAVKLPLSVYVCKADVKDLSRPYLHQLVEIPEQTGSGILSQWKAPDSFVDAAHMLMSVLSKKGIALKNADRIMEYLVRFPGLMDILPIAIESVREHFGEVPLSLELYTDPEIPDEYLNLRVRPQAYEKGLSERLHLVEAAYIQRLADTEGWLQLVVDF